MIKAVVTVVVPVPWLGRMPRTHETLYYITSQVSKAVESATGGTVTGVQLREAEA